MTNDRILIKIIPPGGYDVYRLGVSRIGLALAFVALAVTVLGGLGVHAWQLRLAEEQVEALQRQSAVQRAHLAVIDREADALAAQLQVLQRQNAAIRRQLGQGGSAPKLRPTHAAVATDASTVATMRDEQKRLARLAAFSLRTGQDEKRLARLVTHVLNVRRLARIERVRMIAALPSLTPVVGAISSGFGWRTDPWPEFHQGVDLAADYGAPVHAAADGTVVWAGWQGGFGIKVEIDHGNGYQSWYAHLSRTAVTVGQHVTKDQTIAYVGATGEATGPHLHYQLMYRGQAIDPTPYLNGVPARVLASLPQPGGVP